METFSRRIGTAHPTVLEVLRKKSGSNLTILDGGEYDREMADTYSRTVYDVESLGKNLRILEFGCFTGIVSASLKRLGHEVTGSDIPFVLEDEENAAFYRDENLTIWPHDLSSGPLQQPSGSFDLIVFTEVLEHLNFNPIPLLREFARILRPGGMVYCATPNLGNIHHRINLLLGRGIMSPMEYLIMNLDPDSAMRIGLHWREWTKDELVDLFAQAGLSLKCHKYGLVTSNRSGFPRKQLVALMYSLAPSLMPNQVAVFAK